MEPIPTLAAQAHKQPEARAPDRKAMRDAAVELEATFLAEMLKSAGLHETSEGFNGGAGEEQFSSLLVREQARAIAHAGGIGLAETFFQAMMEAENGTDR